MSIWTQYFRKPFEESIEDAISCGLTAGELSTEHGEELFKRSEDVEATGAYVKAYLAARNFTMTQGHLPIGFRIVSWRENLPTLLRYIDLFETCGVQNMVLHCEREPKNPDIDIKNLFAENVACLKIIADHIKGRNIYICLENLYAGNTEYFSCAFAEDLIKIIQVVGSDQFGICLDTGHLHISKGNQGDFIRTAGSLLRAIHIADNRGERDDHLMPYHGGKVDFVDVVKALDEISYNGLFNLEIPGESGVPEPLRLAKVAYIQASYEYLKSQI